MSSTDDVFDVEEVLGCRDNTERGRVEYLIRWLDYDEKYNSWESAASLSVVSLQLARTYEEKMNNWRLPHPSTDYRCQAKQLLSNTFQRVSCAAILEILRLCKFNFTRSYHYISSVNQKRTENGDGAGQFELIPKELKVFIKKNRPKTQIEITDVTLLGEIVGIPALNRKEVGTVTKQRAAAPKKLLEPAIDLTADSSDEEGEKEDEKECGCCFADYQVSALKQCSAGEGHYVCRDCIQHYVSEQLDGNGSTVFKCIASADCKCKYSLAFLDKVLSPTLKKRANERVALEEIKKAGENDETLWQCPTCAYFGFFDQKPPWIHCPTCNLTYCTSCNENHTDRTCEEFRREQVMGKDLKHLAAEAMSRACKRSCPHCGREYIKSDGCNKIKCRCGELSCYLCGSKIADYSHFCNKAGCHCSKCQLWTNSEAMERVDREKRLDAGRTALREQGADEREINAILSSLDAEEDDQSVDTAAAVHRGEAGNLRFAFGVRAADLDAGNPPQLGAAAAAAAPQRANPPVVAAGHNPPQRFAFGVRAAAPIRAADLDAGNPPQRFAFGAAAAAPQRANPPAPAVAADHNPPQRFVLGVGAADLDAGNPPQQIAFGAAAAAAAPQRANPPAPAVAAGHNPPQRFVFGAAADAGNPPQRFVFGGAANDQLNPQQPFRFPQFNLNCVPVQVARVHRNQQLHNVNQLAENLGMMGLRQRDANEAPANGGGRRHGARVDDVNGGDLLRLFCRLLTSARAHAMEGRESEMNDDLQRARDLAERPDARLTHGISMDYYIAYARRTRSRCNQFTSRVVSGR